MAWEGIARYGDKSEDLQGILRLRGKHRGRMPLYCSTSSLMTNALGMYVSQATRGGR